MLVGVGCTFRGSLGLIFVIITFLPIRQLFFVTMYNIKEIFAFNFYNICLLM